MLYKGKGIGTGVALGKMCRFEDWNIEITQKSATDPERELNRFFEAKAKSEKQLRDLYGEAKDLVGEKEAGVFRAHLLILNDNEISVPVIEMIENEHASVEYAVTENKNRLKDKLLTLDMPFMQERRADIEDVCQRLLANAQLAARDVVSFCSGLEEDTILYTDDLMPSEVIRMDRNKVKAVVLRKGTEFTHVSILSKAIGLPLIYNVEITGDVEGKFAIVDSDTGELITDPDESQTFEARRRNLNRREFSKGAKFFRSEYMVLASGVIPGEEEQFNIYKNEVDNAAGRPVVIRTFDLGSDKIAEFKKEIDEPNPALGERGIRFCMNHEDVMRCQLRALLRASVYGEIKILVPMIISVEEVDWILDMLEKAKAELTEEGITGFDYRIGAMIETPAAVMLSDKIAQKVDFMWIGINDLTQFTLAVDRQNAGIKELFDPDNEAVRLMKEIVFKNAAKYGCETDVCG